MPSQCPAVRLRLTHRRGEGTLPRLLPLWRLIKRPIKVDMDAKPVSKCGQQTEALRAVFAAKGDDGPAEPINIACLPKTVQFENHMILG